MKKLNISAESELLIKKLRENPFLARLVDYAFKEDIHFLIHPESEKMTQIVGRVTWMFFCFPGLKDFFIFVPFDKGRNIILPDRVSHQIFCFAHELGHYKLKDNPAYCQIARDCEIWHRRALKDHQDVCLLKELLANLEAAEILKKTAKVALKNHGWQMVLLNLWSQCSECLKEIKRDGCLRQKSIAKVLRALAKKAEIYQKDIEYQMENKDRS